jgi:flagellar protein FlaI
MTYKERFVRKVTEVLEMRGFDPEAKRPIVDTIFKWNPLTDRWDVVSKSKTLLNVSKLTGTPVQEITDELQRRMKVLSWMWERGITYYKDVYKVICDYYTNPRRVLAAASIR